MNLQTLVSKLGVGPLLLIVLVGLGFCFAYRSKPWVVFIWMPITAGFAYGVWKVFRELSSLFGISGPDAGFAGIGIMFLLPILGVLLLGLVACIFCTPRKVAWRLSFLIPTLLIYSVLLFQSDRQNASSVEIQLFDAMGKTLPGVRVEYSLSEGGLGRDRKILSSDATGKFSLEFRQGQEAELKIMPSPASPQVIHTSPTFWNLDIGPLEKSPGQLAVRHSWQRSIGWQTLNEGFTEVIPQSERIHLRLTLPDHASLDPAPRSERIRAAFAAFEQSHPPNLTYANLCRNVEAIEFIPQLIEVYRNKKAGSEGVVDGLAQIAAILTDLERGCSEVQRTVKNEPHYPRHILENQIAQFCIWAGIPDDSRTDVPRALEQVQEKIAAYATLLVDFALDELPRDPGVLKVPSELRRLARPHLPRVLAALLENPPKDTRLTSSWSRSLGKMGAYFNDLQPLFTSENPLLVIIACDATPNDQLKNGIAAKALARLEATRPQITDTFAGQRADGLMKMLRMRLK